MNREQLLTHYALMGWVAWLESGDRYNISRPGAGTYWAWPDLEESGYNSQDMYVALFASTDSIEMHEIPDAVFRRLVARVREEGHES